MVSEDGPVGFFFANAIPDTIIIPDTKAQKIIAPNIKRPSAVDCVRGTATESIRN